MVLENRFKKNKLIFLSAILILLLFFLINSFMPTLFATSEVDQKKNSLGEVIISKKNNAEIVLAEGEQKKLPIEKPIETKEGWSPMGDEASKAKIIAWFESRGVYYFRGPEEQDDYKNYDVETLKKLSISGDVRAMHTLADKAESIAESNGILFNAAIHGSTGALMRIGSSLETEFDIENKSVEERRPYIVESLAYYEAAQLRGDWWGNISDRDSLLKRYPIDLSAVDKSHIQKRAQEIYDDLQQRRTQMGLGDFDNSVPDEVIKFYEEMVRPL